MSTRFLRAERIRNAHFFVLLTSGKKQLQQREVKATLEKKEKPLFLTTQLSIHFKAQAHRPTGPWQRPPGEQSREGRITFKENGMNKPELELGIVLVCSKDW